MKPDYQTNTIEGAEAFERMYGEHSDFSEVDDDGDYGNQIKQDDEDEYCGCSDIGCPCDGIKYGKL